MDCYRCQFRPAKADGLCEECGKSHLGMHGVTKPIHRLQSPTFDKFKISYLDPDTIKGLFWADDALLQYEYYQVNLKETGKPQFTPLLEGHHGFGEYKEEHSKLERWFIEQFFAIFQDRLKATELGVIHADSLQGLQTHFFEFRRKLNTFHTTIKKHDYIKSLPDIEPIKLLLKKLIVKNGKDPSVIDSVAQVFDPGSALFFLELYVTLQDSRLLESLQQDLIRLPAHEIEKYMGSPSVILLPWDHQRAAYEAWSTSGKHGIIEMATATGKTFVGLMAIEEMARTKEHATIRVISNSRALLNQWKREAVEKLGLLQNVYLDYNVPVVWQGISVHFETIQKVMVDPEKYPADLLIVDEVHHLAGPEFRRALAIPSSQKMGLSATVEGDVRLSILQEALGPVVYQFTMKDALVNGIIPSFEWNIIPVYLAVAEADEFASVSKAITLQFNSVKYDYENIERIAGNRRQIEDLGDFIRLVERARYRKMELPEKWKQIQALILKRRWIIHKSQPRLDHAIKLAKDLAKNRKIILFTMDTESCDYIGQQLRKDNDQVYVIHSNIKEDPNVLIQHFRHAKYGALIGAQMMSEGIDIPDAEIGINVAASKTRLQLTQRMGRILRKRKGKEPVFYHYVALPEPQNYIPEEDDVTFLDDLAWVQDTALRMGLDANVVWDEDALKIHGTQVESSFHNRFFGKDYRKIPKFGTFSMKYVTSQLSEQAWFRIVSMLQRIPMEQDLEDAQWSRIVRAAFGKKKKDHLDMPGFWWLLILGKRRPDNIVEIFNSFRPDQIYVPNADDERIINETIEELQKTGDSVQETPPLAPAYGGPIQPEDIQLVTENSVSELSLKIAETPIASDLNIGIRDSSATAVEEQPDPVLSVNNEIPNQTSSEIIQQSVELTDALKVQELIERPEMSIQDISDLYEPVQSEKRTISPKPTVREIDIYKMYIKRTMNQKKYR